MREAEGGGRRKGEEERRRRKEEGGGRRRLTYFRRVIDEFIKGLVRTPLEHDHQGIIGEITKRGNPSGLPGNSVHAHQKRRV
jgi:hypothetical protein